MSQKIEHKIEPAPNKKMAPEWGIKREEVVSDSIISAGYDDRALVLEIEFKNENVYRYYGVKPEVYASFRIAESKGKLFQSAIRGKYDCRKVVNATGEPEPWTVDKKPASAEQKQYLHRLLGRAGWIDGFRDERVNASLQGVAKIMGAPWNGTPLLSTWLDTLTSQQIGAGIEWLKGARLDGGAR
jgi:hypothetical protein